MHLFRTVREPNVDLKLRAGALFFIIFSIALFSIVLMNWYGYVDLYHIVMIAIAITYLIGGTITLKQNERKGMVAIFVVNLVILVPLLVFFLLILYAYYTHPCYADPMSCDDQLTDHPALLMGLGILSGILALLTYISWRLQRGHTVQADESEE